LATKILKTLDNAKVKSKHKLRASKTGLKPSLAQLPKTQ